MKPATYNTEAFDEWIRSRFVELNSQLEQLYYQQSDRANVQDIGTELKQTLESEGRELIKALLDEGNTDEGFDSAFDLLGNVGLYM
ncbi:MAG: monodechloroaminopyrrolnitrin synthase PrnB family protein, partial [Shewanella sp.]